MRRNTVDLLVHRSTQKGNELVTPHKIERRADHKPLRSPQTRSSYILLVPYYTLILFEYNNQLQL